MNKTVLYVLIGLVVVILLGAAAFAFRGNSRVARDQNVPEESTSMSSSSQSTNQSAVSPQVRWQQTAEGWQVIGGTAPACPDPFVFQVPADLSKATAVLYPGQTRGGNYKPHGGLRFDNSKNNEITVTAPYAAQVVRGSRYLVNGETQYTFDFMADCGVMYRLGHLLVLTPEFQKVADSFPAAQEGDSRTENVNPPVAVKAGEKIATSVGVTKGEVNTFFDWGVYDLRQKNEASKDATWSASPMHDAELAQHAVCWFDWLSSSDEAKVRSLPAGDPTSGKTSDYCK